MLRRLLYALTASGEAVAFRCFSLRADFRIDCAGGDIGGKGHHARAQDQHFPEQQKPTQERQTKEAILIKARIQRLFVKVDAVIRASNSHGSRFASTHHHTFHDSLTAIVKFCHKKLLSTSCITDFHQNNGRSWLLSLKRLKRPGRPRPRVRRRVRRPTTGLFKKVIRLICGSLR